jgi:hypothetical protein
MRDLYARPVSGNAMIAKRDKELVRRRRSIEATLDGLSKAKRNLFSAADRLITKKTRRK